MDHAKILMFRCPATRFCLTGIDVRERPIGVEDLEAACRTIAIPRYRQLFKEEFFTYRFSDDALPRFLRLLRRRSMLPRSYA